MSSNPSEEPVDTPAQLLATLHGSYQLLGRLLDSHRNYLLKIIGEEIDSRLNRRHGSSDIVQTAFLNVLENFRRTTEGIFAVRTEVELRRWLRQVCLTALRQEFRDEGRALRDFRREEPIGEGVDHPVVGPSPSGVVRAKEREEVLREAINTLPEADRILLRLREFHGWKYPALAELVDGEVTDAGRVRMQRRLMQLRFDLGEDEAIQGLE